ncbi:MAG: ribbon-helix-helix protein, CopG family [Bryobacteraceae bacterium]|jgi:metal-responsive CopG/Arc/MetJ family transcriptional regulator
MLSKTTVKLSKSICERARRAAEALGYSSREEFIEHAIEKELANFEAQESKDDVMRKLKGLGYLK